ncbi:dimethylhistidine N-methyltransferase [Hymenobacter luteus]|uniref:Dimethylhistidine N-methyltransferase n=2 Tax=Hymenobacter TaxID=89966 RepID=A0A7W9T351_9BACT|nr:MULTISPECIES: L-histidine N(alpha)-methyltransferase [Hymenobacter]MBB4602816.1 dimethylhistidine N-methyltransferase [Hymenobacter latericoloratus]MBB6060707.1 dimethylhistidine N-methyltransferase [Hymenobacter luteus]
MPAHAVPDSVSTLQPLPEENFSPAEASSPLGQHVREGLSRPFKTLSSMYFYDDEGSRLFQQIMALPEYYPTRTEFGLLTRHQQAIGQALRPHDPAEPFFLLELGAGDGLKTKILLRHLLAAGARFTYVPVDISSAALEGLATSLRAELPTLRVEPVVADYAEALRLMASRPGRKAVLFLGSNIGNFLPDDRHRFLQNLAQPLTPDDRLLIGFDLQKDPRLIRAAYDDSQGVTARFNLNLLHRLNQELGANFDLNQWQHYTDYDPLSGAVRSFLVSRRAQAVHFSALNWQVDFAAWEMIHTENSYKFSRPGIAALASAAGLAVQEFFTDEQDYFADVILRPAR